MSNPHMGGIAAVFVVPAAIIAIGLASCQVGSSEPTATPTVRTSVEPTATPVPRLNGQDPLDAGRYQVNAGLSTDVTVAVPSGWSASGDWVVIGPRENDEPDGMAIRFFRLEPGNIPANPLSFDEGILDPPPGPTVDDLVEAIVNHPGWTASAATDITIDGRAGQLVTITIPMDVEMPADDRFFLVIDPSGGGGVWGWAPGQTFDWYIVDVDGQRLIIDSFHYPGTSEEHLAAQRTVVESVQFGSNP
jgi:hypothetical protein